MRPDMVAALSPRGVPLRCRVCTIRLVDRDAETAVCPSSSGYGVVCATCAEAVEHGAAIAAAAGRGGPPDAGASEASRPW